MLIQSVKIEKGASAISLSVLHSIFEDILLAICVTLGCSLFPCLKKDMHLCTCSSLKTKWVWIFKVGTSSIVHTLPSQQLGAQTYQTLKVGSMSSVLSYKFSAIQCFFGISSMCWARADWQLSWQPQIYDFVYMTSEIIIHHSIEIPDCGHGWNVKDDYVFQRGDM